MFGSGRQYQEIVFFRSLWETWKDEKNNTNAEIRKDQNDVLENNLIKNNRLNQKQVAVKQADPYHPYSGQ